MNFQFGTPINFRVKPGTPAPAEAGDERVRPVLCKSEFALYSGPVISKHHLNGKGDCHHGK